MTRVRSVSTDTTKYTSACATSSEDDVAATIVERARTSKVRGDRGRVEDGAFIEERDVHEVVANVALALDLLRIRVRERHEGRHVEDDLVRLEACIDRIGTCARTRARYNVRSTSVIAHSWNSGATYYRDHQRIPCGRSAR